MLSDDDIAALPYRPCVGVMLTDGAGRLFAGARMHGAAGAWQAPQGGIDDGEEPQAAALRELEEETGVQPQHVMVLARTADWHFYDLPHDVIPNRWGGRFRGQKQIWYLIRLDAGEDVIDIAVDHPEFSDWRWMTPEEMIAAIVPFKRPVYKTVLNEFAEYLDS